MTTSESETVRAYVNERGVSVQPGASALDAVRAFDPVEAEALALGTRRLTDSRGLPIAAESVVHGGAIYRLLTVREPVPFAATENTPFNAPEHATDTAPADAPKGAAETGPHNPPGEPTA